MSPTLRRSTWFIASVLAASALIWAVLAGSPARASDRAAPAATSSAKLTNFRIALDWTPNINHIGIYVAIAKGYFTQAGLKAQVIPYADTAPETLLKTGKADLGIVYPSDIITNRNNVGLDYKAVAAIPQKNTSQIGVSASSKYTRPAQLNGTTYGGLVTPSARAEINAVLRGDGVTNPHFTQVSLNTGGIEAVSKGRAAFTIVYGGIDDVIARLQGIKLRLFPISKYLGIGGNYPDIVFAASDTEIDQKSALLRQGLAALAKGYEYSVAHPAEAEAILINANRTVLGKSQKIVAATGTATLPTLLDSNGKWGTLTATDFSGLLKLYTGAKVLKGTPQPVENYFTASLLPNG